MFDPIFDGLAGLLSFYYSLVPNYAVAIALLTVTVMLLLFPLNAKAQKSMAKMSLLQPELKRIQSQYKDDKVKQQEETLALFRENNVTPLGGCLPLLVQGPVLFIMYRVLYGLTKTGEDGTFEPQYLSTDSELYQALDRATEMQAFGLDLAETASDAARASFVGALPFFVLIAVVVGTGYFQQYQISRRNQGVAQDNPIAKQMQTMTKIFPLMYLVFGFTLPAGLNVYFLVSNVFRIGQQALIYKLDPSLLPENRAKALEAKAVDTTGTKGSAAPAVEERSGSRPANPRPGNGKAADRKGPGTGNAVRSGAGRPTGSGNKKKKKRR